MNERPDVRFACELLEVITRLDEFLLHHYEDEFIDLHLDDLDQYPDPIDDDPFWDEDVESMLDACQPKCHEDQQQKERR
jgi:hypothetical protein